MLKENKVIRFLIILNLVLLGIFLLGRVDYFTSTLKLILSIFLVPMLLAGFLYYLLRPMVRYITNLIHSRFIAIIITFLAIIILWGIVFYFGGSIIQIQFSNLINQYSNYYSSARNSINNVMEIPFLSRFNLREQVVVIMQSIFTGIKNNLLGFFSTLTNIGTILVLIPFVLFYLLKDDEFIYSSLLKLVPEKKRERINNIFVKTDNTLAVYIGSQVMIAIVLGFITLLGYLIIGLPNALILAFIAMVTTLIPFIGPILGSIPAIFIAVTESLLLVVKVLLVVIITQQLENNIIRPQVQGEMLRIHPLIIIFLVLTSIILFGFLGALFSIPFYAVIRVIFQELRESRQTGK